VFSISLQLQPIKNIYDVVRWSNKKYQLTLYADIFFIRELLTLELRKSTVGAILREINFDEGTVIISSLERRGFSYERPLKTQYFVPSG
jgi:hypothetical protein